MRKDYTADQSQADETSFVEDHWTRIWEREGGPKGAIGKVPRRDEYKIMAPYLADLAPCARILDAGCGMGEFVLHLASQGHEAVGLDLSRRTVEQLNARFPEASFVAGDIRATDFADGHFDVCFSWGVFEHFEAGPQACLREARRVLKPGGLLFASMPYDNLRHALLASVRGVRPRPGDRRFYQYRFTRGELAQEFAIAGFDVVAVKPIHKRQGVLRSLQHELGLPHQWLLTRALSAVLAPFVPAGLIAHMALGIARKPLADPAPAR
jgi:SAM-dependent methyltransferase